MKKKLLISITSQFGYHTDTYMYCKYLDKTRYEVHYVGFDLGYAKRVIDDVKVHYISVHTSKINRYWIYLNTINKLIRENNYDIVFQVDHKLTLIVRLCNLRRKFILDIRTGDLNSSNFKRAFYNSYIYITSLFYRRITIISESLRNLLRIPAYKTTIIPLGAETRNINDKTFLNLNLFYIGTLQLRNIDETVEGLALFNKNNPGIILTYDIVGTGKNKDVLRLQQTIIENDLQDIVIYHGQKNHDEISDIWEHANVGIVYLPITPYYDCQPTTKLYECLLAGMPVIATNTFSNRIEIQEFSGVICNDNKNSFSDALTEIYAKRHTFDSTRIKNYYAESTWQSIVCTKLSPLFDKVTRHE